MCGGGVRKGSVACTSKLPHVKIKLPHVALEQAAREKVWHGRRMQQSPAVVRLSVASVGRHHHTPQKQIPNALAWQRGSTPILSEQFACRGDVESVIGGVV